jgi:hypothetical protein
MLDRDFLSPTDLERRTAPAWLEGCAVPANLAGMLRDLVGDRHEPENILLITGGAIQAITSAHERQHRRRIMSFSTGRRRDARACGTPCARTTSHRHHRR